MTSRQAELADLHGKEGALISTSDCVSNLARLAASYDESTFIWPEATHGLLKASAYNWQLTDDWSCFAVARFFVEGRHTYAPGALDTITGWIQAKSQDGAAAGSQ